MSPFHKAAPFAAAILTTVLLAGCTVAEAASPEPKNSPSTSTSEPVTESTPMTTPTPEEESSPPQPIPETTTNVDSPEVFTWGSINGTWCPEAGDCIKVFDYGTGTGNNRFVMQQTEAPDGCLLGTATNHTYPGSMVMICPAWTHTPASVFGTTASYDAVTGDDYTQERMWFYQGIGSPTFFRK